MAKRGAHKRVMTALQKAEEKKKAASKRYGKGSKSATKKPATPSRSKKGKSLGGLEKVKKHIRREVNKEWKESDADNLARMNRVYENFSGDYKSSPGTRRAKRRKK